VQAQPYLQDNDHNSLQLFFKEARRHPIIPKEEQLELVKKAQAGDNTAREKLITCNLRFVVQIAKQHQNRGLPLLDLVQEGVLGLIKAIEKFDSKRDVAFIAYAEWWIMNTITRALLNNTITRALLNTGRLVRLSGYAYEKKVWLNKVRNSLNDELGRVPTVGEIAAAVNKSVSDIQDILDLDVRPSSLDATLSEEGESFLDLIPDPSANPLENPSAEVSKLLDKLTPREKEVITRRFGLNGNGGISMTLEEIGKDQGVTRERIRQIEAKAMEKLQRHLACRGVKYEDIV